MSTYEKYSNPHGTNLIIAVINHNGLALEYQVLQQCCEDAEEFLKSLERLQNTVKYVKEQIDYGYDELAGDYLTEVWDAQSLHDHFEWECEHHHIIFVDKDYKNVKKSLYLKSLVDSWLDSTSKEDIMLEEGYTKDFCFWPLKKTDCEQPQ